MQIKPNEKPESFSEYLLSPITRLEVYIIAISYGLSYILFNG